ncbi:endonuclease/exonuclease/phosphatase family protein [Bacteroidota bacterium]
MKRIPQILFFILFSCFALDGLTQTIVKNKKIVKVLSLNILHGATTRGDFNLDMISEVIIQADPDLVALQEVDYQTNRSKKYDLTTELGWRCKMVPLFGRAMYFDGGEYGDGILSKHTIIQSRNVGLPFSSTNEPRTAVEITTVLNSGDAICFIGTHLDHTSDESDRIAQASKINEVFSSNKFPTILAGDLNAAPGSNTINTLEKIWSSSYDKNNPAPTFPSKNPRVKIDYVMFIPEDRWKVIETEVIENEIASDHCGYLVTLELLE